MPSGYNFILTPAFVKVHAGLLLDKPMQTIPNSLPTEFGQAVIDNKHVTKQCTKLAKPQNTLKPGGT
jgi:hypothetical protein